MKTILIVIILTVLLYGCVDVYGQKNSNTINTVKNDNNNYSANNTNSSTIQTAATHSVCNINKCVQVEGSGISQCTKDDDCSLKVDSCNKYSNCDECVISVGCGWCSAGNLCQSNGSNCAGGLETTCTIKPQQPTGCAKYTNCADCLQKGDSCKWCIEKSTCAEATETSQCNFGLGWLNKDYQCYITSK